MISWGLVIAACALIAGIGSYADNFIEKDHKDRVQLALISLYDLIDKTHISNFVLILARILSGKIATTIYFVASSIAFVVFMYFLYNELFNDITKDPPPEFDFTSTLSHPVQIVIFSWLCMLPSVFIVTWAVRQFANYFLLKRQFRIIPFIILISYFAVLVYVDYASDLILDFIASSILHGNKLLAAISIPLMGLMVVFDFLDDLWPVILFTPIAILFVTVSGVIFYYLFRLAKWSSEKFIDVASSPERSPYTFFGATISLLVLFLKVMDEFRKLLV